jgi:hypothetical protein
VEEKMTTFSLSPADFSDIIQDLNVDEDALRTMAKKGDEDLLAIFADPDPRSAQLAITAVLGHPGDEDDLRFVAEVRANEDGTSMEEKAKLLLQAFRFSASHDGQPAVEIENPQFWQDRVSFRTAEIPFEK